MYEVKGMCGIINTHRLFDVVVAALSLVQRRARRRQQSQSSSVWRKTSVTPRDTTQCKKNLRLIAPTDRPRRRHAYRDQRGSGISFDGEIGRSTKH